MQITIKLFASLRNQLGKKNLELELPEQATVQDALTMISLPYRENIITMVNGIHCQLAQPLKPGDVLSVFPMIAGG